ncbi:hypothetical protein DFA_05143 [Cavenderia fasciculata]|uniref:Uncharacterized protein n=1 Tax=Cavenderia fasciculata TaxID=261658 RepID=F4PNG0_CACFS|nr:uncharacterized protein DFA_05143 [Cavenderia fasciculata]EGG23013.1 hypothetical protein DFA_05143 [Cavenderia fasciculata]|eukprot:XP_004360864.1 hypothetical protein DFA_05143 [Cavenderia fasciculata]
MELGTTTSTSTITTRSQRVREIKINSIGFLERKKVTYVFDEKVTYVFDEKRKKGFL